MRTKRWNDPVEPDDGYRLLVCRYRPRGVKSENETWDGWAPQLGPSVALHAAAYGKNGPPISWDAYKARYLREMQTQGFFVRGFARKVAKGEPLTLLCSSACTDASRCHRSLLRELIERAARELEGGAVAHPTVHKRVRPGA